MLSNLITDRTEADVAHWQALRDKGFNSMTFEEYIEWSGDLKGAYNASDLNRVGNALEYLRNRLIDTGYIIGIEFTPKVDWKSTDVPTTAEFTEYLRQIGVIRGVIAQKNTTPLVPPDTGGLDYVGANNIEQILIDVDDIITLLQKEPVYCGEVYAGET